MNSTVVQGQPQFSVVIPTYNRLEPLAACLEALTRQDFPQEQFEVIIVNDGSKAYPEKLLARQVGDLSMTILHQEHGGPARARNLGVSRARGKFLAFTDDDCCPHPQWLKSLAARLSCSSQALIGGRILNALPRNPFSTASQLLIEYLFTYYHHRPLPTGFFTSNNLALAKDLFQKIGGFDPRFGLAGGEDREFSIRWLASGYSLTYAPEALVFHAHSLNLFTFWSQHFNYGRGAFLFHRVRSGYSAGGFRVEPVSFYWGMFRHPISETGLGRGFLLAGLLFISQLANALGFCWEGATQVLNPKPRQRL